MLDLVVGHGVLRVPDIMRDELFNLILPGSFQIVVIDIFDLVHQALDILYQDIIARDEDALLSPASAGRACLAVRVGRRLGGLLRLGRGRCATSGHGTIFDCRHGVRARLAGIHNVLRGGRRVLTRPGYWPALLGLLNLLVLFLLFERGLVLLLLLILFISGQRHVHLHFDLGAGRARNGRT